MYYGDLADGQLRELAYAQLLYCYKLAGGAVMLLLPCGHHVYMSSLHTVPKLLILCCEPHLCMCCNSLLSSLEALSYDVPEPEEPCSRLMATAAR